MSSTTIYAHLLPKSINLHYLARYVNYIDKITQSNSVGKTQLHHILPKAKDMFPELFRDTAA